MAEENIDIVYYISKTIGYLVVVGSTIVKFPQILKIFREKSVVGISLMSVFLELLGLSITVSYALYKANPFSTWGECLFMTVQNLVIIVLIFHFSKTVPSPLQLGLFGLYLAGFSASLLRFLDPWIMDILMQSTMGVTISAKLPQIRLLYANKTPGTVSFVTWFLTFGGSVARLFTIIKELNDTTLIVSYVIACTLNGIIVAQLLFYWNNKPVAKKQ